MGKPKLDQLPLSRAFLRMCRAHLWQRKVADSSGQEVSGGALLSRSLALSRILRGKVLARDERMVGVLLPPSLGAVLANAALPLLRRIPVNLNYTVSETVLNSCISQCGIRHILTSRRVTDKMGMNLDAELVYVEDLRTKVTWKDKLAAALETYVLPAFLLERLLGLNQLGMDDLLTVIFTSGSTGEPKGVMLTHRNVASNIDSIDQIIQLSPNDVFLGVLPFFHSYGFTVTLWTALSLAPQGIYHYTPLDARRVGELCQKYGVTIVTATPTFLRSYLRRCSPEQLSTVDVVMAGAEKLPADLADAFEEKFGVRPYEAYGATELSPLAAANMPAHRSHGSNQKTNKEGTVGRPVPGVSARVVHPDTGDELGVGQAGMLQVAGPNVMKGYLGKPELTAEVVRHGWYVTGDIAQIDDEGFIQITDRHSRFSKIGGEMVPHIKVEETLAKVIGRHEEVSAVVTAVPDPKKGERLIVLHKPLQKSTAQICKELAEAGLPNIWIPSPDSFLEVEDIPVLGTGKLDLKGLKALALEKFR